MKLNLLLLIGIIILISSCDTTVDPKLLPVLSTTEVVRMTEATAYSGGFISSDAGYDVLSRGVCWSETPNPTIENNKTIDAAGSGSFESTIDSLKPSTTYYIRAYATNKKGTAYGLQVTFKTKSLNIETTFTAISSTYSECGGNIETDGDSTNVFERGICWSTSTNPTTTNSKIKNGFDNGKFTCKVNGLAKNTKYFLRAYAINSFGITYGNEINFTTSSHEIGENYQGGKIVYILQPNNIGFEANVTHGLIVATTDQSTGIQWDNGSSLRTGASGSAVGTGNSNTITIVYSQGTGNYAARLCYDLVLNGYSDWYLPSIDELSQLYLNRTLIGGLTTRLTHWSSSEYGEYEALGFEYSPYSFSKSSKKLVRAYRSF